MDLDGDLDGFHLSKTRDFHGICEIMMAFMMGFRWIYKPTQIGI